MPNDITALFSKKTDDWKTPSILYKAFMETGHIDVSPFQSEEDYLLKSFSNKKLYCNPPYSKNKDFVKWLYEQYERDCEIWLLIPSRTDTKYFQRIMNDGFLIYFICGRLHFNDSKDSAPFPSALINISKKTRNTFKYENGSIEEFIRRYLQ